MAKRKTNAEKILSWLNSHNGITVKEAALCLDVHCLSQEIDRLQKRRPPVLIEHIKETGDSTSWVRYRLLPNQPSLF
jgi:hypothetical protein